MLSPQDTQLLVERQKAHEIYYLSLQEIRTAWTYYVQVQPILDFPTWLADEMNKISRDVECEVCGGNYVKNEICPVAITRFDDYFDPEQPDGHHITFQTPLRVWNK